MTNPKWNSTVFHRFLYNVVAVRDEHKDHIPAYLEKYFGSRGFFCKSTKILKDYGDETTSACGLTS